MGDLTERWLDLAIGSDEEEGKQQVSFEHFFPLSAFSSASHFFTFTPELLVLDKRLADFAASAGIRTECPC